MTYDLVPPKEIFSRISRFQQKLADAAIDGAIIIDIDPINDNGAVYSGVRQFLLKS